MFWDFLRTLYFNFPFFVRAVRKYYAVHIQTDTERLQQEQAQAREKYAPQPNGMPSEAARGHRRSARSRPPGALVL